MILSVDTQALGSPDDDNIRGGIMNQLQPIPGMETILEHYTYDSAHYNRAKRVLAPDFVRHVATIETAQAACECLLSAQILLGPYGSHYRKALDGIRKILETTIKARLLPGRDFDQRLTELEAAWLEVCGLFKAHLPAEVWEKIGKQTEEVFAKVRLREGLKG
jgi:hypothetical protein